MSDLMLIGLWLLFVNMIITILHVTFVALWCDNDNGGQEQLTPGGRKEKKE